MSREMRRTRLHTEPSPVFELVAAEMRGLGLYRRAWFGVRSPGKATFVRTVDSSFRSAP